MHHWLITLSIEDFSVKVVVPFNYPIDLGLKCNLKFKRGEEVFIFPGNKRIIL